MEYPECDMYLDGGYVVEHLQHERTVTCSEDFLTPEVASFVEVETQLMDDQDATVSF